MRKSDKKIDNQLRLVLTDVCENALKEINGFQWLTHLVNYDNFPQSLNIVCVFDSNENLALFLEHSNDSNQRNMLNALIQRALNDCAIKLKNINNHVHYDSEERCLQSNNGNWAERLAKL